MAQGSVSLKAVVGPFKTAINEAKAATKSLDQELKLAQGFPAGYVIDRYADGTRVPKSEQVRRIGNSVVPLMARRIVEANVEAA